MNKIMLDGSDWRLIYVKNEVLQRDGVTADPKELIRRGYEEIPARVPGNLELDLMAAGKMKDPFFGDNVTNRDCEYLHSFYIKSFAYSGGVEDPHIIFEGVDTIADVYLNGAKVASLDNMLISHKIRLGGNLHIGENTLVVHIKPAVIEARRQPLTLSDNSFRYNKESLYIRKAPHTFGWDIMPRIVSAGIWRPVYIKEEKCEGISEFAIYASEVKCETCEATLYFLCNMKVTSDSLEGYSLKIEGKCGESSFEYKTRLYHTSELGFFTVNGAKFWWPKNYGEPNLYDVKVTLVKDSTALDVYNTRLGIRTAELKRSSVTDKDGSGEFCFLVNGQRIFCMGTNWVPVDAFHSRDKSRIPEILPMLNETNCNIIRIWGGNVYEDDYLYDFCDENGIMIWQDFIMGCAIYPQDDKFAAKIYDEIVAVVKRLRHHPSIVLWAGDNENDIAMGWSGQAKRNPNSNVLSRVVIPKALHIHDYTRPYLPSSPFIDNEAYESGGNTSEDHLWGPRDYFKGRFYGESVCHFASETGYHACPSPESVKRFIPKEYLFTSKDSKTFEGIENPMWLYHSSCPDIGEDAPWTYRIRLMSDQVTTLFGDTVPNNLSDFAKASQISQAEAKKYFIERFRISKWRRTGIIWWNLIDGWPQFSDAIVDYYGVKKLAYHYVTRSQMPLCLMFDEPKDGKITLYAVNDKQKDTGILYTVKDVATGEILLDGSGVACANASVALADLEISAEEKRFLLIEWKSDEGNFSNHYMTNIIDINYPEYLSYIRRSGYEKFEGFED